ncbi:hypothetical protein Tco_0386859 [Tanacetum coccineum]
MSNPFSKPSDASPIKIEAPKELPKVSLVNESLKKLKFHLTRFDNVVKIRTTPDARIEGEWGFEHTKAVFNNEIIPFLKSLKDIFNVFDRELLNEMMEVQTVFDQIDAAVQQSSVDKQCLKIAKKELLLENDRLLEQIMSQDVLLIVMNSMSLNEFFENNDLKAQLQDKDTTICKLKDIIKSMKENSKEENVNYDYGELETKNVELENSVAKLILENERLCNEINHVKQVFKEHKGKEIVDSDAQIPSANTIVPGMFKLDLEHLDPRLLKNREANIDCLKITQEQADILRGIVEQAKAKQPSDNALDFALRKRLLSHPKTMSRKLGLKCSTSNCGSMPTCNKKNDRISRTLSRNIKNKVEAQPRKVNKKNSIILPIRDVDVKHSLFNANSKPMCATCCPDCSLISGLWMFETYDREPLSAHKLSCALGKSKKSSHQPKAKDTNQEKLYLFHMDLCGPMRVASINGKSFRPGLHSMTPATLSSGLIPNLSPSAPFVPPSRKEWDLVFKPMFDEFYSPPPSIASPVPVVEAPDPVESTGSPSSTTVDQDTPSLKSLKKYGMESCDQVDTLMVEKSKLDEDTQGKAIDPTHYHGMGLWYSKDSAVALTAFVNADARELKVKKLTSGYHFIKEQVKNRVVELYFVKIEYQLAEIFTKALCRERIEFLIDNLGMRSFTLETLKELADEAEE